MNKEQDGAPLPERDDAVATDARSDEIADPTPTRRRSGYRWPAVLFLILLVGIGGYFRAPLSNWLADQGIIGSDQQLTELGERLGKLEASLTELNPLFADIRDLQTDVQQQRSQMEKLAAEQQATRQLADGVSAALAQQLSDWRPIEVRHLLFLADQRLHIAGDPEGAMTALRRADELLKIIDQRRWLPLRTKITAAITDLATLELADTDGIRSRLAALGAQVDRLSDYAQIRQQSPATEVDTVVATEPGSAITWEQRLRTAWARVIEQLGRLVSVEQTDQPLAPVLSGEQLQGLKFRLSAELLLAEVDLLRRDAGYQRRLAKVRQLVSRYFDPATQPAAHVLKELDALQQVKVDVIYPDISGPLTWLDNQLGRQALD